MPTPKQIANTIRQDWKNISPYAKPYIDAMATLSNWDDKYYLDSAADIVARFLCNAGSWRGDVARETKAYLKQILTEV